MPNRLARETSPYLLQHAENPVDWYAWGDEAFARARAEDRPILLSIGYAACHWCHVMAHESFEDEVTAALMNERFVNVKVDREERPDVDGIYMQAVQAMTGHGGWPMTMFLTPEGEPFYGGTYFPPDDRHGMPSFRRVLESVSNAWATKREQVARTTASFRELYEQASAPLAPSGTLTPALLERAYRGIAQGFDPQHGGFGGAPKFPPTMVLEFLLAYWRRRDERWALDMVERSWRAMAHGGLHDQLGGGFHRYCVDAVWLVPHFEKMLYDNALLVRLGAHLWQATGDRDVRRTTEQALDWLRREMTDPAGGFHASLDADSEGEEGRFYVWTEDELRAALGDDAPVVAAWFGVQPGGNFEGTNVLHRPAPIEAVAARTGRAPAEIEAIVARAVPRLLERRERRERPGRDDKVLAAWNGLMLRGVATAARVFGREADVALARGAATFLRDTMVRDGRVWRSWTPGGPARIPGFLEDHAALALGFLEQWQLTFEREWLDLAALLGDACVRWFWDDATASFFDTASDAERLVTRPRDVTDNAVPSGTALACELLLRLDVLLDRPEDARRARHVLETLAEPMARHGTAFGHLLGAADLAVHGAVELALVGAGAADGRDALAAAAAGVYVPSLVLAAGAPDDADDGALPLLAGRTRLDGRAAAYVCRARACDRPTASADELRGQLAEAGRSAAPPPGA